VNARRRRRRRRRRRLLVRGCAGMEMHTARIVGRGGYSQQLPFEKKKKIEREREGKRQRVTKRADTKEGEKQARGTGGGGIIYLLDLRSPSVSCPNSWHLHRKPCKHRNTRSCSQEREPWEI